MHTTANRIVSCILIAFASASTYFAVAISSPTPTPAKTSIGTHRQVKHTDAYKRRPELGEYIAIKVTPPEKRGKERMMLVEVYNYTKTEISAMRFDLYFKNKGWEDISSQVDVDDMRPNWSDARWLKIPDDGKIPALEAAMARNVIILDKNGKDIKFKVQVDLIKE